jgi:hypothetical protein
MKPVCCAVCKKRTAVWIIKDCGLHTYPVCNACKLEYRPDLIHEIKPIAPADAPVAPKN